jgi:hypothetical protein
LKEVGVPVIETVCDWDGVKVAEAESAVVADPMPLVTVILNLKLVAKGKPLITQLESLLGAEQATSACVA